MITAEPIHIRTPINTIIRVADLQVADVDAAFGAVFRDAGHDDQLRMVAGLRTKDGTQYSALASITSKGVVNDVVVVDGSPVEQPVVSRAIPPLSHPDGPSRSFADAVSSLSRVSIGRWDARQAARLLDEREGSFDATKLDSDELFVETFAAKDSAAGVIERRDLKGTQYAPFQDLIASVMQVNLDNANRDRPPSPFPFPL